MALVKVVPSGFENVSATVAKAWVGEMAPDIKMLLPIIMLVGNTETEIALGDFVAASLTSSIIIGLMVPI